MSGKLRVRLDVRNKRVVDDIEDAIEAGIRDSIGKGRGGGLEDRIVGAAKQRIRDHERVWRGDLLDSFETYTVKQDGDWYLFIENNAEHARTTEYGRTPGEEKPPLAELIPWVESQLGGWHIDTDYYDGGGGGPGAGESVHTKELPRDQDVVSVETAADADLEESANSDATFVLEYESGARTVFKANERSSSLSGITANRNEAAFSDIADIAGFSVAPEARFTEQGIPVTKRTASFADPSLGFGETDFVEGAEQAFVEGAKPLFQERISRDEVDIINDYREELAKTSALDIIVGNTDRHSKNYIVGPDGEIHAIDNGGHNELERDGVVAKMVRGPNGLYDERSEEMYEAVQNLIQEQNEAVGELVAHSDIIIEKLRQAHGEDHWLVERAERLLANDGEVLWDELSQLQDDWLSTVDPDTSGSMPEPAESSFIEQMGGIAEDIKDEFENL